MRAVFARKIIDVLIELSEVSKLPQKNQRGKVSPVARRNEKRCRKNNFLEAESVAAFAEGVAHRMQEHRAMRCWFLAAITVGAAQPVRHNPNSFKKGGASSLS